MAQEIKALAIQLDDPSSFPRAHIVKERANYSKLSSDRHVCVII